MRTTNNKMSTPIHNLDEFKASNVFAEWKKEPEHFLNPKKKYIVYSYGYHYPMYIYIDQMWIGNSTKYSTSTSRHMTQAYPGHCAFYCSNKIMKQLADSTLRLEDIGR